MPTNPRLIALCIAAFLLSASLTYTIRKTNHHHTNPWFPSTHSLKPGQHSLLPPTIAYATFLPATGNENEGDPRPLQDDGPFTSARILAYQLLHSQTVGTNNSIPFLILCTRNLLKAKWERLKKDGATVILVEDLAPTHEYEERKNILARLRIFQLTQYSKILYLDPSTLVTRNLDKIFYDEATLTASTATLPPKDASTQEQTPDAATASLPRTYMFASHASTQSYAHPYPPNYADEHDSIPAFHILAPGKVVFEYYLSLLKDQKTAWSRAKDPAEEVLKHAHRRAGAMPWRPVWYGWNIDWPGEGDWRGGAHSFTAEFWDGGDPSLDAVLKGIWREQRAEMEGFYRGRDG
ncbi:hypothetical protein LTR78_002520 [Recurvomyces mirabilis]|uniref:Nucleotide-diphospho-sugar transferase n=1 Tax=Recurvomyces mirabilis TaxID=574656 RepID=A0AAE1C4A6_9PEZI|nr:hypothetical protein LTR78_002520 [Recurvomyces mirabilis]KAK5157449.1 hypothetical protein LTS14_004214 [Recurvomyces mirabilis]